MVKLAKRLIFRIWPRTMKHRVNVGKRSILELVNQPSEVPFDFQEDYADLCRCTEDFLKWLKFSSMDTSRHPDYKSRFLISFLDQDIIESMLGILRDVRDGVHNRAKREARFLLELSIKLAVVEQQSPNGDIDSKVEGFRTIFDSPNIGVRKGIKSTLLVASDFDSINERAGRLYGESSNFVHLTTSLMKDRRVRVIEGRTSGYESRDEFRQTIDFLRAVYTTCLVYLMESLPGYVVEDWFATTNVSDDNWYFFRSRVISRIDESYDYKHERSDSLASIKEKREQIVEY